MSRMSARKVKLTSKFEEFSTSGMGSKLQRLAHHTEPQDVALALESPIPVTKKTRESVPSVPVETPAVVVKKQRESAPVQETPVVPTKRPREPVAPFETPTPIKKSRDVAPQYYDSPMIIKKSRDISGGYETPAVVKKPRGRPRKCLQKAETVVKPVSSAREELLRLREENAQLRMQLDQAATDFEDLKRQSSYTGQTVPKMDFDDLKERYQRDIAHAKRHEWCVVCLNPSRYYCCWNTTYCSQKCQVHDWYQRHLKNCERRRALKNVQ